MECAGDFYAAEDKVTVKRAIASASRQRVLSVMRRNMVRWRHGWRYH